MSNSEYLEEDFDEDSLTIRNCIFGFKCNKQWDELTLTSEDEVKFCQTCQKEVYFCSSDDELAAYVRLNRCVAIQKQGLISEVTMGYVIKRVDLD